MDIRPVPRTNGENAVKRTLHFLRLDAFLNSNKQCIVNDGLLGETSWENFPCCQALTQLNGHYNAFSRFSRMLHENMRRREDVYVLCPVLHSLTSHRLYICVRISKNRHKKSTNIFSWCIYSLSRNRSFSILFACNLCMKSLKSYFRLRKIIY